MKQRVLSDGTFSPKQALLILVALIACLGTVRAQICPRVQGLGSPVNIFHTYINTLLKFANPSSDESVTVTMVNEQSLDSLIYRYIFRVTTRNNRVSFIGILSQITQENIKNQSFAHNVVRFIQSSDIRDAQRLLGIYDATKDDELNCGNLKETLAQYSEKNGFNFSGDMKSDQQRPFQASSQISNSNLLSFLSNGSSSLLSASSSQASANSPINLSTSDSSLANIISQLGKNGQLSDSQNSIIQSILGKGDNSASQSNLSSLFNSLSQSQRQSTNSPVQIKPFPLTVQPLQQNQYTLGSVLSGTGRDKIFQRNSQSRNEGGAEQVVEGKPDMPAPSALLGSLDPKLISLLNQMKGRSLQAQPTRKRQRWIQYNRRNRYCMRRCPCWNWHRNPN